MMHLARFVLIATTAAALAGCGSDYSPNTYDSIAVQQANKVDQGVVIGYRQVAISDDGTVGTVTGGAAGGILGAETDSPTVPTALMALGGTVVGGLVGNTVQHAVGDTTGWEYIVREPKGDLVSVVQKEPKPIAIGQRVLVIEGKQARIVPDYAAATLENPPAADEPKTSAVKPASATVPAAPAATPAAASATVPAPPVAAPATASAAAETGPSATSTAATPASTAPASAATAATTAPTPLAASATASASPPASASPAPVQTNAAAPETGTAPAAGAAAAPTPAPGNNSVATAK